MPIFGLKLWVNPFGKVSNFGLFEVLVFIAQKRIFFVLEYRKRHSPGLYCLKRKVGKWPFLDKNHGLTPLEKCEFLDVLNYLFLQLSKAFFRSRISLKTFSQHILPKKKRLKNGHFWTKPWVNPFEKMSIFRLFVFMAQKVLFFVLEYRKRHFPGLYCQNRKVEKTTIFGPKPWVNPFGKVSIF